LLHQSPVVGLIAFRLFGPINDVRSQPVEGLVPQVGTFLVVEIVGVIAPAAAGQGRDAGGIVAMAIPWVLDKFRLRLEGSAEEPCGGGIQFLVLLAHLSQEQALGIIRRLVVTLQDVR
jgi:hypothetical protein